MNLRFNIRRCSALVFVLAAGATLAAQETGNVSGIVSDAQGNPIAGARVALSSPKMIGVRVIVTGARGEWRAPLLPVGNYKVAVSKEGWVGSSAENVRIGLGASASQNLTMRPVGQASATVEVVAGGDTVDKAETTAGTNFSAEKMEALPTLDRSFTGAADMSAGLNTGVNGSFSIRGGTAQNTQYRVNGTDVKDDYQGDLTGTYVIEDNIEDVQVILSPLNARNGRALGGAVNVVTKTGSNEFAGSIRSVFSRNTWSGLTPYTGYQAATQGGTTNDTLRKEYQVTFNGPIVKDRLWFAVGTILKPSQNFDYDLGRPYAASANAPVQTRNANVNSVLNAGPAGYAFTKFDEAAPYNQVYDDKYYEGKLTGAITSDHTLEFSYSKSDVALGPRNPFGDGGTSIGRIAALGSQTEVKQVYGFNYRGVLSSKWFIEARWNKLDSKTVFPSGDPAYGTGEGTLVYQGRIGAYGTRTGLTSPFGLGISPLADRRDNRSGNINVKTYQEWFGGTHEIDAGIDYYQSVRGTSRQAGMRNLYFRVGGAYKATTGAEAYLFPTINFMGLATANAQWGQDASGTRGPAASVLQYTGHDGTTKNNNQAIYVNDQWTVNSHWNVMLGLRWEKISVDDTDGTRLGESSDFSPRMQVRYDVKGDSQHLITATLARYGGDFSTGFTDAFIKKADGAGITRGWGGNAFAPGDAADPSGQYGVRFVDYATLTDLANYNGPQSVITYFDNSKGFKIAGDLRAPYMDEATISYRRGWKEGSNLKLTYVYRQWKKDWAFALDYNPDYIVEMSDPTGSGLSNQYAMQTRVFNSDELRRVYQGLEMEFTSKLSAIWTVGGNWTVSRLVGNNNGGEQGSGGQTFRDNTPSGYYFQREALIARGLTDADFAPTGPLVQNQGQRGRIFAMASLPMGDGRISYSWALRYNEGRNFSATTGTPITPAVTPIARPDGLAGSVPGVPVTYTQFYGGRGQYSQNDTYRVDFKVAFSVPLGLPGWGKRVQLIGDVQVTNLFNSILVNGLDSTLYAGGAAGQTTLYLDDAASFGTANPANGDYWSGARSVQATLGLKF